MKKIILFVSAAMLFFANAAIADSVAGKVGITFRGGASYIFNSEFTSNAISDIGSTTQAIISKDIKADLGYGVGGGIMYGINDNLAVNFDVIYTQADVRVGGAWSSLPFEVIMGKGKSVDFALGAQWRFLPKSQFVPYVEGGLDIMLNYIDISDGFKSFVNDSSVNLDVDTTYGGHLSFGGDFFFDPHLALNAEIRGLLSSEGDVKAKDGFLVAHYNPSNISVFLGIKYFIP